MTTLLYEASGGIATITLNRPESRNALNLAMCEELRAAADGAAADPALKLVLIRANGPVFCAGADLKERQGMSEAQVREVLTGNLCRCTGYQAIVEAALLAAERLRSRA